MCVWQIDTKKTGHDESSQIDSIFKIKESIGFGRVKQFLCFNQMGCSKEELSTVRNENKAMKSKANSQSQILGSHISRGTEVIVSVKSVNITMTRLAPEMF